ncbi:MAG: hypothetical protein M1833_001964 [Piccolia ochrophora]|nr:MAG: hypothetical protein M1833_001964 [Piccolia ochrophora]
MPVNEISSLATMDFEGYTRRVRADGVIEFTQNPSATDDVMNIFKQELGDEWADMSVLDRTLFTLQLGVPASSRTLPRDWASCIDVLLSEGFFTRAQLKAWGSMSALISRYEAIRKQLMIEFQCDAEPEDAKDLTSYLVEAFDCYFWKPGEIHAPQRADVGDTSVPSASSTLFVTPDRSPSQDDNSQDTQLHTPPAPTPKAGRFEPSTPPPRPQKRRKKPVATSSANDAVQVDTQTVRQRSKPNPCTPQKPARTTEATKDSPLKSMHRMFGVKSSAEQMEAARTKRAKEGETTTELADAGAKKRKRDVDDA